MHTETFTKLTGNESTNKIKLYTA